MAGFHHNVTQWLGGGKVHYNTENSWSECILKYDLEKQDGPALAEIVQLQS